MLGWQIDFTIGYRLLDIGYANAPQASEPWLRNIRKK